MACLVVAFCALAIAADSDLGAAFGVGRSPGVAAAAPPEPDDEQSDATVEAVTPDSRLSPQQSCVPGGDQVAFFMDAGYEGLCVVKGIGDYPDSNAIGLPNDSITSIKVGESVKVRVCRNESLTDICEDFTGDDPSLVDNLIGNDTISSARVEARSCNPSADQVAFFMDAHYTGLCVVKGIGDYPDSGAIGLPNDSITSIKVGANVKARVCRNESLTDICEDFTGDDPLLTDNPIGNDTVSSARVEARTCAHSANQVAFFVDGDYTGFCIVRDVGEYPTPLAIGLPNDSITSIRVGANARVTVCGDSHFGGTCETLTADDPNVSDNPIGNDTISSARVELRGPQAPDLRPYAPPGYTYPVVPASVPGTRQPDTLWAGGPTYFDWHFINAGTMTASGAFHVELRIGNAASYRSASFSNVGAGEVRGMDDLSLTISTPGWHRVSLVVDIDNTIREADETNNDWSGWFCWEARTLGGLSPSNSPFRVFLPMISGGLVCQ